MPTRVLSVSEVQRLIRNSPRIPASRLGGVEVRHRLSQREEVVSARKSIMLGMEVLDLDFAPPLDVTELRSKQQGLWMTSRPCELWQMQDGVRDLYGHALIGGLGLGIATHWAARRPLVHSVTTVENDPRVVALVWPHLPPPRRPRKSQIVTGDLYTHLQELSPRDSYDSAFYDIWQGTGEMTWVEQVVPLERLSRDKVESVGCWLEGEMRAQIGSACVKAFELEDSVNCWWPHDVFRQACRRVGLRPAHAIDSDALAAATKTLAGLAAVTSLLMPDIGGFLKSEAGEYLRLFLSPHRADWEEEFGALWDSLAARQEERHRRSKQQARQAAGENAQVGFVCQIPA